MIMVAQVTVTRPQPIPQALGALPDRKRIVNLLGFDPGGRLDEVQAAFAEAQRGPGE